jgi:hypothetical protein
VEGNRKGASFWEKNFLPSIAIFSRLMEVREKEEISRNGYSAERELRGGGISICVLKFN